MRTSKITSLILAFILIVSVLAFPASAEPDPVETGTKVIEYDFSKISSLDEIGKIENVYLTAGNVNGVAYDSCEIVNNKLKISSLANSHCFVTLFDYIPAVKDYTDYTITLKYSFDTEGSKTTDTSKQRAGIIYNLTTRSKSLGWAFIRAKGDYENGCYIDDKWKADGSYQKSSTLDGGFSNGKEYTLTAHMKPDGTIDMCYYDADGNVIGDLAKGIKDYRSGQGIGLYLRACTMYVSYFSVTEYSAVDPVKRADGNEIISQDFSSVTDVSEIDGFAVASGSVDNVTISGGKLSVAPTDNTYHVLKLLDYSPAGTKGNAWTAVIKASFSSDVFLSSSTGEAKNLFGIAFDIDESTQNYNTAVLRSSGEYDLDGYKGNAWVSGTRLWDRSFVNYYPEHEYEIMLIAYSDGTVRMAIDGVLSEDVMTRTDLTGGIGVVCRNAEMTVSEITVYENAANGVSYKGTQSSGAVEAGEKYNIRFVATMESADASAAGFIIKTSYSSYEQTKTIPVASLLYSVAGSENGMSLTYTANDLAGNYLYALGIYGIPADIGDVTFTITPYYVKDGVTNTSQSYEVVYNAGDLISQSPISN